MSPDDRASIEGLRYIDSKINEALKKPFRKLLPIGACHNCTSEFPEHSPKLFCDKECAEEYDRYENHIRRT